MPGWISVVCKNCSAEFSVHEDWQNTSEYCRDCLWYEVPCELCKQPLRVRRDWGHPPRVHKECRDAEAANWLERPCRKCGAKMRVHRDWRQPPAFCKACKEIEDALWVERPCRGCGVKLRIRKDWRNPPIFCKTCKEAEDAKWYEQACRHCGKMIRLHRDWKHKPEYHDECAWYERPCEICSEPMKVHRGWARAPRAHKECLAEFAPREVQCPDCANLFTISTATQLRCREKGWELPRRCDDCKGNHRLIQAALTGIRHLFRFGLIGTVHEAGTLFEGRVVVICGRKTGEPLAEVQVGPDGSSIEHRLYEGVKLSPPSVASGGSPSEDDAGGEAHAATVDEDAADDVAVGSATVDDAGEDDDDTGRATVDDDGAEDDVEGRTTVDDDEVRAQAASCGATADGDEFSTPAPQAIPTAVPLESGEPESGKPVALSPDQPEPVADDHCDDGESSAEDGAVPVSPCSESLAASSVAANVALPSPEPEAHAPASHSEPGALPAMPPAHIAGKPEGTAV